MKVVRADFRGAFFIFFLVVGCESQARRQAQSAYDSVRQRVESTDWKRIGRDTERQLNRAGRMASRELDQASDQAERSIERVSEQVEDATAYAPIPGAREGIRCRKERCTISVALAKQLAMSPERLAAEAVLLPSLERGRMVGLRVVRVPPGSIPEILGFRPGDVVGAINDQPLSSPNEAIRIAREMQAGDDFEIRFRRDGRPMRIVVVVA